MIIPAIVGVCAMVMIWVEIRRPGRGWPAVLGWWTRALVFNGVQVGMVFLFGATLDGWLWDRRPWSGDGLGVVGGAIVGYVAITFVFYWWHRARHHVRALWLAFHQIHHSPQRIEIITAFYKHPAEIAANGLVTSAILYLGVGLDPLAASYAIMIAALAELFYHWNVATPWWMGFLIQRPESHCVHHQEGLHQFNYGDLPLWDMLFGTFRNPRHWEARCGFGALEHRLGAMILGVDVNKEETA